MQKEKMVANLVTKLFCLNWQHAALGILHGTRANLCVKRVSANIIPASAQCQRKLAAATVILMFDHNPKDHKCYSKSHLMGCE